MNWNTFKKEKHWISYLPVLGFFIAYCSFLWSQDIWTDEAFMMQVVRETTDLKGAFLYAASDTHPPLYFVLLKAVTMIFGQTLPAAKMISILALIGSMLLGVWFFHKYVNYKAAVLYAMMVGVLPCSMAFSVEIRMYGLALFFLTGCGLSAFRIVLEKAGRWQDWAGLFVFGVGAAYTHYFSLAATALIYGFLLIATIAMRKNLENKAFGKAIGTWFVSVIASVIAYIPWLPYFYAQFTRVSGGFWIPEITWSTVKEYTDWYFATDMPYTPFMLLTVLLLALGRLIYKAVKEKKNSRIWFSFAVLGVWFMTILVGVAVSAAIRPIFLIKYSFQMIGLLCVAFAMAMYDLPERTWLVLVCFLFCIGLVDYDNSYTDEYESTKTVETMDYFRENLKEGDLIAYNYNEFGFIYAFYFKEDQMSRLENIDFSEDYGDHCIYLMDTTWNQKTDPAVLEQYGWQQEYVGMYGIEHNIFKLYKLTQHTADMR